MLILASHRLESSGPSSRLWILPLPLCASMSLKPPRVTPGVAPWIIATATAPVSAQILY